MLKDQAELRERRQQTAAESQTALEGRAGGKLEPLEGQTPRVTPDSVLIQSLLSAVEKLRVLLFKPFGLKGGSIFT